MGRYQYRYRKYRHIGTFFSIGSIGIGNRKKLPICRECSFRQYWYRQYRHIGRGQYQHIGVSAEKSGIGPSLIIWYNISPIPPVFFWPGLPIDKEIRKDSFLWYVQQLTRISVSMSHLSDSKDPSFQFSPWQITVLPLYTVVLDRRDVMDPWWCCM